MKQQVHPQDIYCQSNNDNHIRTSCAFYVESMQVEPNGELGRRHRKRERDIADWGERENSLGFKSGTLIWF